MTDPRITMFMPGLRPDALGWDVHLDLARAVEAIGPRFQLLTTDPSDRGEAGDGPVRALAVPGLWQALARPAAPALRTRSLLPAAGALARHLRAEGDATDLLHVEVAYPHAAAAALARRRAGWRGPLVVTPMGEDTLVLESASYGFRRHRIPRALVAWTLGQADLIRCISPLHERCIAEIAPTRPRLLLPLNVSAAAAAAALESDEARERRRRTARSRVDARCGTAGRPVVLALGRLHPFKGVDVLIRALARIPEATLVIVGPSLSVRPGGDVATALLRLADEMRVSDRVRWMGASAPADALEWLAGVDVVAVPSHLESLNKVCVEAAAIGTPFVVTETTGIAAWVSGDDSGVGRVVPPARPDTLAGALRAVIEGRCRVDRRAQTAFVRPFRPEAVAQGLVSAYRGLRRAEGAGR